MYNSTAKFICDANDGPIKEYENVIKRNFKILTVDYHNVRDMLIFKVLNIGNLN